MGKSGLTRRTFLQGLAAAGAVAFAGCDGKKALKEGTSESLPAATQDEQIYWGTGVHNCGAEHGSQRCASRLHVKNGRLVRVTSDEDDMAFDGSYRDKNLWTDSRSLTCTKCRAYKYRLYHAGRLKYPLVQTKQRGDMTGFVRVSSEKALNEIARKYRAIYGKYSSGAIHNTYGTATGYAGTFNKMNDARDALTHFVGGTQLYFSDYSYHQYNHAWSITGHPGVSSTYTPQAGVGQHIPDIAGVVKNIVSWGSNILTTNNTIAYAYLRSVQVMKERCAKKGKGGKVYHISPEFVDTGVTIASDWVQIRNYTDTAMIMAMLYEMIINTFNADGSVKKDPWLDLDYIDTFVYGFFDSPEYWVMADPAASNAGEISLTKQTGSGWRRVEAVEAGKSLSAYVMGSDDRLRKAAYAEGKNYTAQQLSGGMKFRNMAACSYNIKGTPANKLTASQRASSKYYYKRDMMTPKTPEWAEAICATPASTIRELAKMYCDPAQHPILNEWSGGIQKQDNGVYNIFAISALMAVTKTFGLNGEGLFAGWAKRLPDNYIGKTVPEVLNSKGSIPEGRATNAPAGEVPQVPRVSCKEWFNGIKLAFYDELKKNGYTGKYIPDWNQKDRYVNDDAHAKSMVLWKREDDGVTLKTFKDKDGKTYYDYERDANGNPVYVGIRMIISHGAGIQLNQHSNTNDTAEMYRALPLASANPDDPDSFCLVVFDNFMTPTARYADYILPATTALEAGDWSSIAGQVVYRPPITKAPGESKDGWRYAYEALLEQVKLGDFKSPDGRVVRTIDKDAHLKYVGTANTTGEYQPAEALSLAIVDKAIKTPGSRFHGMTREQVFAEQLKPRANAPATPSKLTVSALRENVDAYLSLPESERMNKPFVFTADNTSVKASTYYEENSYLMDYMTDENKASRPEASGRIQVYSGKMVWDYENRHSKYHGWLPAEKRGQQNKDYEGDKVVLPIPVYFHFQDCFNEMYGVLDGKNKEMKDGLTLGTTHDRYRVHSSLSENPLLRELNHRTRGGGYASGNDWNEYAVMPEDGVNGISPMISGAVYNKDKDTASWHEIWINTGDAKARGISDGDLVLVENPIGAVRVIARVTDRCVKGHVNLHQGAWYDPNPADGIDDGGCANTLMSSKGSRFDHGNSQQMALVTVKKIG